LIYRTFVDGSPLNAHGCAPPPHHHPHTHTVCLAPRPTRYTLPCTHTHCPTHARLALPRGWLHTCRLGCLHTTPRPPLVGLPRCLPRFGLPTPHTHTLCICHTHLHTHTFDSIPLVIYTHAHILLLPLPTFVDTHVLPWFTLPTVTPLHFAYALYFPCVSRGPGLCLRGSELCLLPARMPHWHAHTHRTCPHTAYTRTLPQLAPHPLGTLLLLSRSLENTACSLPCLPPACRGHGAQHLPSLPPYMGVANHTARCLPVTTPPSRFGGSTREGDTREA